MPENTDMTYYEGMVDRIAEGVGSAGSAIGKRATGRTSSDPAPTPNTPAPRRARRKQPTPPTPTPNPRTLPPGARTRRKKTSDADKKTFTDLEQGADIKRKAAEVRKKKDPKNKSLRPRSRPKNATSLRPKVRPS
jgi:hypothetical protein